MEDDDPWGWSVDRIVQEFCTDKRSWGLRAASSCLPDPAYLEKVFRENEITGDILLLEIDDKTLREDLQISKLGWRSFIRYGIEQLRERSAKYQDWYTKERRLANSALIPEKHGNSLPSVSSQPEFNFTINSTIPINFPAEAEGLNSNSNQAGKDVSDVSEGNKRRRMDDEPLRQNLDQPLENDVSEALLLTPSLSPNRSWPSDDTIEVTRQQLSSWPEINPEASLVNSSKAGKSTFSFDSNAKGDLLANAYDHPDALNKYNMLRGGDEELPLYGESGSENGFDTETWEAIDEEAREMAAYIEKEKQKNKFLTPQEVEMAVDAGIADLVSQWQETKLPKRRQKAFRLWKKSRRTGSKHADILKAQQDLKHLVDRRIPKLRENIILGQWSNEHQVRHQTRIMEVTIFDREDLVYTISLLQKKSPPPKLTTDIPVKPKKAVPSAYDSNSGESIHSESSGVESVRDIGDFVVEELDLADDEEDVTMSDDSLSEAPMTPARGVAKPVSRSKSSILHDHTSEGDHNVAPLSDDEELGSPEPMTHSSYDKFKSEWAVPLSTSTPKKTSPAFIDLVTPDSNRVSRLKSDLKATSHINPIILSSESDKGQHLLRPVSGPNNPPSLTTPATVSRFGYKTWEDSKDRDRLIVTAVDKLPSHVQKSLFELIATMDDETKLRARVEESIDLGHETKGLDEQLSMALLNLVRLFWIFIDCKFHLANDGWMRIAASAIRSDDFSSLHYFYTLCKSLQGYFNPKIRLNFFKADIPLESGMVSNDDEDSEPQGSVKRKRKPVSTSDSEEFFEEQESPSKKPRKFFEDANARNLREQDRARVTAQEERKKQLRARLMESDNVGDVALDRHIINEGKFDDQGYIYIDKEIGKRIKPHQLDGVRFIWNQITADGKATQGCLLAHTMGLGKTMQTITILVALAQAASSKDESISSQVPESLRVSKTIVLCPPGLIANWVDELLTWSPDDILGDLRPVESASSLDSRFRTINDWFHEGGILLIGYDMFRKFITTPKPKPDKPLTHSYISKMERAKAQLLEGPNIIVADEAHKMKNYNSALNWAASQFKSKTRIALTGSPLANNVEEYHTMVEWVAPNYLGPIDEFRKKYKEPIEQGLFIDSSRQERFNSKKMLEVLKGDLSPKVHRADTSVLRDDLPPKKEFVINVSLTELQKQAYITYVRSMSSQKPARTKSGELKQTTVWSYINILTLLCNHPYCFKAKLDERSSEVHGNSQSDTRIATTSHCRKGKRTDVIDEDLENDPEAWKIGVSEDLISAEAKVFESVESIRNPELSNKVRILCQILDASKAVGDKVLVFSQTLVTLDFLEDMCKEQGRKYARLDGKTAMGKRQAIVKDFNSNNLELYLISTNAGGLGLNLYGANRVVIFDFRYNPINEEQAIGRAYRIGQKKHVFVYRLMAAGTFENSIQNKAVFKTQLASRVVDKKNPLSWAQKGLGEILFEPRQIPQENLTEFEGMDNAVLDNILSLKENKGAILKIIQSDDFEKDDDYHMTPKEKEEFHTTVKEEKLKRSDPEAYQKAVRTRKLAETAAGQQIPLRHQPLMPSIVKNEIVNGNKPRNNFQTKNPNSDIEEISAGRFKEITAGRNAKETFVRVLKTIARTMHQFADDEYKIRQRAIEISKNIQKFYENKLKWDDERQRVVYQRAYAFVLEKEDKAQKLLTLELGTEEFITRVSSWWKERPTPKPVSGKQVQNSALSVNHQELGAAVPLTKNGNSEAVDGHVTVESVISPQCAFLAAGASKSFDGPSTRNPESVKSSEDSNIIDRQSKQATESEEQNVLSQDSTGDIPNHIPNGSLSEVIEHPGAPSVLIAHPPDKSRVEQSANVSSHESSATITEDSCGILFQEEE
ncbi:hypothetical protein SS1G_07439 [Sclerotinia sclerotiorum 1980 UF-70]|uniref:Uncharacterized protein n=1 Tax=Sclerotinia sclerotiorum (strain ATCC 18683 / 1980 / Ss-1) TaxID=665079 RepID=A7EQ39_SCLS1|nr:hypothetical protein SS1G_07439 [Sclerotinia sclerotiorum 1980 UF-70]EDO04955.1 hypothetical protein SS1G_07439 [Sclerotinia sclerotiorum 1980 UF-70]